MDHIRLFRNHPQLRWKYRVHEQIIPGLKQLGSDIRGRLTRRGPRPESEKRRPGRVGARLSVLRISLANFDLRPII